jgi:hypothetical protein
MSAPLPPPPWPAPPPLEELVRRWGGYSAIPAEAWAQFEAAMEAWKQAVRLGVHWHNSGERP